MHFVKKVPTTDAENELKAKEQAKKLKQFVFVRDKVFGKRVYKEYDNELLTLTEGILSRNPDIYTFWNIRREVLDDMKGRQERGEAVDVEALYTHELTLCETCITANPKSYSAWFQRGWVLKRMASPDLKKELKLCELALSIDCRNFHCWDHRRIVAAMAGLTAEDELNFSQKLVSANFSNFSAWHMRMHLLPRIKDERGEMILSEEVAMKEVERVANAIFTDPADQSAWMFARWLIDIYSPSSFLNGESSCANVPLVVSLLNNREVTLSMTRPSSSSYAQQFIKTTKPVQWDPICIRGGAVCRVWRCTVEEGDTVEASLDGNEFSSFPASNVIYSSHLIDRLVKGGKSTVIESIRDHCEQLLQEEKDNSFAVHTLTQCLRALSPLESHASIISHLSQLATSLDPLRRNMYSCFLSQERIRKTLMSEESESTKTVLQSLLDGNERLSLKYLQLIDISFLDFLAPVIRQLDLRGNDLSEVQFVSTLPLVDSLTLDENPMEELPSSLSSLNRLEYLSIGACKLFSSSPQSVSSLLNSLPSLKRFLYCETSLVESTEELRSLLSNESIRLIPYYL